MTHRRILHIFGRMQRGGAEVRTIDVMRHLDRDQFTLLYCALSGLTGDLDEEIRSMGGDVVYCKFGPLFPVCFLRLLKTLDVDVVHSHVHHTSGPILALAWMAGVTSRIAHFRSMGDGRSPTIRRRIQRVVSKWLIARTATSIVGVTESTLTIAWSRNWQSDPRCRVIYNGVPIPSINTAETRSRVRTELELPEAAPVVIHVGRMDAAKNHLQLIEIFAALHKQLPDARLLLVGRRDAGIEAAINDRATSLGIHDAVRIVGLRDDVAALLTASDLLLLPSIREGLPGVVLEAAAVGLPALASDLPGNVEISQYLPTLLTLPLSHDNDAWAAAAIATMAEGYSADCRTRRINAFQSSPFTIEQATAAFKRLWMGGHQQWSASSASSDRAS